MNRRGSGWLAVVFALWALTPGCDCGPIDPVEPVWEPTPYALEIPPFFPPMDIPEDNRSRRRACNWGACCFGKRLSEQTRCLVDVPFAEHSFSDPNPYSTGVTGAVGNRNAMALINMGWATSFFWDGRAFTLEEQILDPIPHPDEMNLPWSEAVERLQNDAESTRYPERFFDAFEPPR